MKKLLLALLLTAGASAQLAPVQIATGGGTATATATFSSALGPPNSLLAAIAYFASDTITIPTGWTVPTVNGASSCPQIVVSTQAVCILTKPNGSGAPLSYIFTQSSGDGISAIVLEVRGAGATLTINASLGGSSGNSPFIGPSVTPTVNGTLSIELFSPQTPVTPTTPSGYVLDANQTAANYHSLFLLHRTALTSDTTTPIAQNVTVSPTSVSGAALSLLIAPGTTDPHPVAYTTGPYSCIVNVPCAMNGSGSYDPNGLALTYAWTFGDGGTSTAANPSHTYASTGSFSPSLIVTNTTPLSSSPATTTASVVPPSLSVVQSGTGSATTNHAPITCTLPVVPNLQDRVDITLAGQPYQDYDYVAYRADGQPDPSFFYSVGGRTGLSTNSYTRVWSLSHIVVPGDGASFTFYPTSNTGGNSVSCSIVETQLASPVQQIAYSFVSGSSSSTATPNITPTVTGTLPLAGLYAPTLGSLTPSTGWTTIAAAFAVANRNTLTTDTTTAISNTFSGYEGGNAVAFTSLLSQATLAATPIASPAAGTYSSNQTISLTCSTPSCVIHYNLNSTASPTCSDPVYSTPLPFTSTTMLGVVGCAAGYTSSGVAFYNYIVHPGTLAGISIGPGAPFNGWTPWLPDAYKLDVTSATVDPNSSAKLALMGSTGHTNLFIDTAIPYNGVDSTPGKTYTTALTPFSCNVVPYDVCYIVDSPPNYGQGDLTLYPIPANVLIEGNPPANTVYSYLDAHALMVDRAGADYELWKTTYGTATGGRPNYYGASAAAIFPTLNADGTPATTAVVRPYTFTSAGAGGTPIIEGVARQDEIEAAALAGTGLNHALRMTSEKFGCNNVGSSCYGYFQLPQTHSSPTGYQAPGSSNQVTYGTRLRLKPSFDISSYSPQNQTILKTLKQYGAILDDIGQSFGINRSYSQRIDQVDAALLNSIGSSNFDVLAPGTIYNGASYPTGTAPTLSNFTASPASIASGGCSTLTLNTSGTTTYSFIAETGLYRAPVSVCPTTTTTYHATAQGLSLYMDDGTGDGAPVRQTVTVTVTPPTVCLFICGNVVLGGNVTGP